MDLIRQSGVYLDRALRLHYNKYARTITIKAHKADAILYRMGLEALE
jgi:hypothetical protein